MRAALADAEQGPSVLFLVDQRTVSDDDHPVLVVGAAHNAEEQPFRCSAREVWSVDNNLSTANLDWEDFLEALDERGVYRGFAR